MRETTFMRHEWLWPILGLIIFLKKKALYQILIEDIYIYVCFFFKYKMLFMDRYNHIFDFKIDLAPRSPIFQLTQLGPQLKF